MASLIAAIATLGSRLGSGALDLLYPPLCASCRAPVSEPHSLCGACWNSVSFLDGPCCDLCGYPFDFDPGPETLCGACLARRPSFDRARAVMRYDDKSRDLILAFKRGDRLDLAPFFAKWLMLSSRALLAEADVIVPVPLHRSRLWARRFNQSAVLALELAKRCDCRADTSMLQRTRRTPSQGQMTSARARRRNVLGAFRAPKKDKVRGHNVLLLDDVYTTGATIEACSRALKRAGAKKVMVLTLARVVRAAARDI